MISFVYTIRAIGLEAIAIRLGAMAIRLEAIASRLEAIRLEAMQSGQKLGLELL